MNAQMLVSTILALAVSVEQAWPEIGCLLVVVAGIALVATGGGGLEVAVKEAEPFVRSDAAEALVPSDLAEPFVRGDAAEPFVRGDELSKLRCWRKRSICCNDA